MLQKGDIAVEMKVILCDTNETICRLWIRFLGGKARGSRPHFQVHHGSFEPLLRNEKFNRCAVISPGNSFGYLGGGFDLAIRNYFGGDAFELWFRQQLGSGYHHVGSSTVVDLAGDGSEVWHKKGIRYIIHVPTIVAPSRLLYDPKFPMRTGYEPVFNATWISLNRGTSLNVDTLIIPGLCSGWVGVPPEVSCKSMCFALRLYYMRERVSIDLQNALIMYYLGYPFKPFMSSTCKEECRTLNININQLQKFNAETDLIESILPNI